VGAAFAEMFERLFGGGQTELILTDPNRYPGDRVDVMWSCPGRASEPASALRWREALTASALMFALMAVRPSPFCVMDEVDAPLDESKYERFAT